MKKIILVYAALVIVVILLVIVRSGNLLGGFGNLGGNNAPIAQVDGTDIELILATTDEEKMKGLSERESLAEDSGMLFVFDRKDTFPFWMKNMRFPIDIIWLDDGSVVHIAKNAQPPQEGTPDSSLTIYRSDSPANYVLELPAGKADEYKIEEGDKLTFKNLPEGK
jgi:uncharacterized membrane protein (UPF0127 family)